MGSAASGAQARGDGITGRSAGSNYAGPASQQRRTRFNPRIRGYFTISRRDMTRQEFHDAWGDEAYRNSQERDLVDAIQTIFRGRQNGEARTGEDGLCERGLERYRSPQALQLFNATRAAVRQTVLGVQADHRRRNTPSAEPIAAAAARVSAPSRDAAVMRAAEDEAWVRRNSNRPPRREGPDN